MLGFSGRFGFWKVFENIDNKDCKESEKKGHGEKIGIGGTRNRKSGDQNSGQ